MKANSFLKVVNPILAVVFLFQVLTGLMHSIIPESLYETLHGGGGGLLLVIAIIHVVLNWGWVKSNF